MHALIDLGHALVANLLYAVHVVIGDLGYAGIMLMMAIESANIPLPSELVLPYAGYFVQQGRMNLHLAAWAGAIGCVLGSVPSYWLGLRGGRRFLARHGRWLLLSPSDLEASERWVSRYGDWAFFLCRMLPVVRTFISLPAGVLRARFAPFVAFTFLGSLIWSYALVYAGVVFGRHLDAFTRLWHRFDATIMAVLAAAFVWYLWHQGRKLWRGRGASR